MHQFDIRDERKNLTFQPGLLDKLIYLPGAAVMLYGLWLALTV
jgi:hypothetical protein